MPKLKNRCSNAGITWGRNREKNEGLGSNWWPLNLWSPGSILTRAWLLCPQFIVRSWKSLIFSAPEHLYLYKQVFGWESFTIISNKYLLCTWHITDNDVGVEIKLINKKPEWKLNNKQNKVQRYIANMMVNAVGNCETMKLRIEKMAPWRRIFALKAPGPEFESLATTSQA